ncbi:MAG: NifB/NifX family molybdenum-iron cluster-binding protein [Clostridiales bacterium]|nr:NifB/NifX family molybdenum-iron cluster-binding protein [Clostridiales bacterium]
MIIAIPLDENKETVCVSFGRAPYYLFHNTETNTSETLKNPAAKASGGAGIQAAQFAADHQTNAFITVRCGQNASEVLLASGINIYKAAHAAVADNLKAFMEGKLEKLTHFHPGFHGGV